MYLSIILPIAGNMISLSRRLFNVAIPKVQIVHFHLNFIDFSLVFYRAVSFYLREHPMLLNDLLMEISGKVDHNRVVHLLHQEDSLPLALKYLLFVQKDNMVSVNEAINQL
jgi:hypothetical protein